MKEALHGRGVEKPSTSREHGDGRKAFVPDANLSAGQFHPIRELSVGRSLSADPMTSDFSPLTTMKLFFALTFTTALATGLMAGVFFAFSTFVMKALERIPAAEGISAMQSINVVVERSGFLVVFLSAALTCIALAACSFWRLATHAGWLVLAGAAVYLFGCIGVTMLCNVPMNNTLATMPAADPAAANYWLTYLRDWTFWNHVRTGACLLSSGLLTWALRSL
jgi:uncharacterized membrane protein